MELKDTIEGMTSEDYKERFKAEYYQTLIRLDKLNNIIAKAKRNKLEFELTNGSLDLLEVQAIYMQAYVNVLRDRASLENIRLGAINLD